MNDLFWFALSMVEKVGAKTVKKLYDYNPNLTYLDFKTDQYLERIIKNKSVIDKILDKEYFESKIFEATRVINNHLEKNIHIIPINSEKYPRLLRYIEDPPIVLYCKGNTDLLQNENCIAVIGTREPSQYGIVAAKKIARVFAGRGFTIVSGLALGIDTAGHQGALEANNGHTIAVMAGSLDKIYPAENKKLAEEIILNDGLLISEIPLGGKTFKGSFVSRDRIQSGLSLGICPVQAPLKSGTHHTINFAKKQNRLIFCPVPVEPKTIEATQGIYELIDSKRVSTIANSNDYDKIQDLLIAKKSEIKSSSNEDYIMKNTENNTNYNLFSSTSEEVQPSYTKELTGSLKSFFEICNLNNLSRDDVQKFFLNELDRYSKK